MPEWMYALTLWQPMAAAISHGPKRIENRPWAPPKHILGQRIAIHAGKRWSEEMRLAVREILPRGWPGMGPATEVQGAVVAVARVTGYVERKLADAYGGEWWRHTQALGGGSIARGRARPALEADPWLSGPYGWILEDVIELEQPVPCRGYQRLWRLPADVSHSVQQQLQNAR